MRIHIRPISDLRNKSAEISKLVHKTKSPVFITRNGREDMVVLSVEAWEALVVHPRLLKVEEDARNGDRGRDGFEVLDEIARKRGYGKYAKKKPSARRHGQGPKGN